MLVNYEKIHSVHHSPFVHNNSNHYYCDLLYSPSPLSLSLSLSLPPRQVHVRSFLLVSHNSGYYYYSDVSNILYSPSPLSLPLSLSLLFQRTVCIFLRVDCDVSIQLMMRQYHHAYHVSLPLLRPRCYFLLLFLLLLPSTPITNMNIPVVVVEQNSPVVVAVSV